MTSRIRCLSAAILLSATALLLAVAAASAKDPSGDGQQGDKVDRSLREQDIYIPYEKLRQVFEKHGRGVFLPYDKFIELWQAAHDKTRPNAAPKPPVSALISEIQNEATVEKDVVRVKAKLKIEVLAEGWTSVPLRLSDAAITSATIDGKPARIVGNPGEDYRLLIEKKEKEPRQIVLDLEFARAISRAPGVNSVSFQSPQAPVSRWRVVIPQAGVKVELHPLIAATEVPAEHAENKPDDGPKTPEQTVVLAFVGAAPVVRIDWTPKAEGATGLAALTSVQSEQQVWITDGVTRSRTTLGYAISRAELRQLLIDVPADQKIVNVFDANVRQWSVKPADGAQRITAELFEPAKSSQTVTIELEQLMPEKPRQTLAMPMVKAVGAGRQQGVLVVQTAEGLRAEAAKQSGLLQVDANELPATLRQTKWTFAYRYAAVPFDLQLTVEKVQPRIVVDSLLEAQLQPERLSLNLTAVYTIEKAGVFSLVWVLPPEYAAYQISHVRGIELPGATAAAVDGHLVRQVDTPNHGKQTQLVVSLSRKAIGRVALQVHWQRDLHQSELLMPTGKAAKLPLAVPQVLPNDVERASGRLVVYAPESLRVNPDATAGLRSISLPEAYQNLAQASELRANMPCDLRPVLSFAYAQEPASFMLTAERRKPQVTVRQLLVARVEDGVVKYNFTFFYNVRYSSVKSLRLDIPTQVAATLRVTTPGTHEKTIEPPPPQLAKGDVAWSLSGETELMGDGRFDLSWEKRIDKLDVGKSVPLWLPNLRPRDVDRAWGQIALVKSETIDVQELGEPKTLRPIDPQRDLITPVASAARAFEFHEDWSLQVVATRYQLEEVKRTSIERAVVRMVVTKANTIAVQALYRMRSARQRLTVQLPSDAQFDAQPLRINSRPAVLEMGQKDEYFVPLAAGSEDKPFLMELRYTLPGDGRRLDLPAFPQESATGSEQPAVVEEYLLLYLPETRTLLGARGPWTQQFCWAPTLSLRFAPIPIKSDSQLLGWVQEDIPGARGAEGDFPTDGRLYVYSTLRPAEPPEGSLATTTIDSRGLDGLVFGLTLLLGVVLLPARLTVRTLAVGTAVTALVLAGVFLPTFSSQILGGVLASAVFIVAVLWTSAYVVRRGRRPTSRVSTINSREHGVDLSQYQPEPPVAEPPAAPTPSESPKPEGGQDNA